MTVQAVYEALNALTEPGLVHRTEPAGRPARCDSRAGDQHHHIACRRCGTVADVDLVTGHAPCLDPAASAGFLIDEAEITFWGLCAGCQASAPPGAEPAGRPKLVNDG